MLTPLVRHGVNYRIPNDILTGAVQHTRVTVYAAMLRQVCRDYAGLPDPRTLTTDEIRFFFEGLRPELLRDTKG